MTAAGVSVAISTRNRPGPLRRCLESLAQGTTPPAEVVVADQSEDDATRRLVAEISQSWPVHYVRARPGGLGAAQNDAIGATSSPVVAVLDDECVADRSWLAEITRLFDSDPELRPARRPRASAGGQRAPLLPVSSRLSEERREFSGKAVPWNVGSGNNFALREVVRADRRMRRAARARRPARGGLDMDLFYRVLRAGGRALYEPAGALVLHERATRAGRIARGPPTATAWPPAMPLVAAGRPLRVAHPAELAASSFVRFSFGPSGGRAGRRRARRPWCSRGRCSASSARLLLRRGPGAPWRRR